MNKLFYIPTTTLNFNNILSSESISPKSFYARRNFGYSRWDTIEENNEENVILLYDSLCSFMRPKSDYEDHPFLIEIQFEENVYSQFSQLEEGIYSCDRTIYFTPWNTRFIFFSEEHKKITLSMSDSSLETKLVELYRKLFVVENPKEKYKIVSGSKSTEINISEIEKDIKINKMKGLLYGYYIGALLSTSKELVDKLNFQKEIHNIFAAILSSFERQPTRLQSERLDDLFNQLIEREPFYKELQSLIPNKDDYQKVIAHLKHHNCIPKNQITQESLLNELCVAKEEEDTKNRAISWIENEIYSTKSTIKKESKPLLSDIGEIIVTEKELSDIKTNPINNDIEITLLKAWINDILSSNEYNKNISVFKEKLSDEITLKARDIYNDKWQDCYAKTYLNKLRKHIRGEVFDVTWDNGLFSSIAAVLTKGDDWEKLLSFMQSKEMYDYRLAFAFYGVINGFANLTRDFTDELYSCKREYVANIYIEFYGQIFEIDPSKIYTKQNTNSIGTLEQLKTEDKKIDKTNLSTGDNIEMPQNDEFELFFKELSKKSKRKIEKDKSIYKEIFKEHGLTYELSVAVKENKLLNKGKGAQGAVKTAIKDILNPKSKNKRRSKKDANIKSNTPKEIQTELFPSENDFPKLKCLNEIKDENIQMRLKENWEFTSKNRTYGSLDHVKYFINLCKKEGRGESKQTVLKGYFTIDLAQKVQQELEEYFRFK